ncbi:MAG: hypothetical protein HUJ51_04995 [Eggerthellaceae bacterium]|nr:hypothetical protein [Eggerthellaceae bacterium]
MDRHICGDFRFSMTRVAIRAALISAQNGKKMILLCPTTILAQRHFVSFKKICDEYAVIIDALGRFVSWRNSNRILKNIQRENLIF